MKIITILGRACFLAGMIASTSSFAQIFVEAQAAAIQPMIDRDEVGYKMCGFSALVSVLDEGNYVDTYHISLSIRRGMNAGLLKAGKDRNTVEGLTKRRQFGQIVMPPPVTFWISQESEGKVLIPTSTTLSGDEGYLLESADLIQTIQIIVATVGGDKMQFAVRYPNQAKDVVVSFSRKFNKQEFVSLDACFTNLLKQ